MWLFMAKTMKNGTITAPKGFLAAGLYCGIKRSGRHDLGLLVCPAGATAAAVFTTNKVVSAAVTVSREHVKNPTISAVIVNSGCANACTGRKGIENALTMCTRTAQALKIVHRLSSLVPRAVIVASTGIIGEQLPMGKIVPGISHAAAKLSDSPQAGLDFVQAIMTTDTKPKQAVRRFVISGAQVTVAGTVKGAGMIAPNMATTLCFLTTDAAISKPLLASALKGAIDGSLNRLTVDGHQSTNDTAIILASGLACNRPIVNRGTGYRKFATVLCELCEDLALQMALDAEGATRMFKVVVKGAATKADAARASRAVADYPLLKCAIHGGDPNWGRIICAVGSVGVKLNPRKLSCKLDQVTVFRNGAPTKFDRKKASKVVSQTEHTITVDLGT
ncbi:MAG: bifunctional ornithine acetyltransferase/N-acetylglutamate synthase, partial [Planctomycetes bacterium RBG_16_55_9]